MHARTSARDTYGWPEAIFRPRGDIAFPSPIDAQHFCDAFNLRGGRLMVPEAMAMALLHEVAHRVIEHYRRARPASFAQLLARVRGEVGEGLPAVLSAFVASFPTPPIYRHEQTVDELFAHEGPAAEDWATEELLLLWLANQNPAYDPVRPIVTDADMPAPYREVVEACKRYFAEESPFGPKGESLVDVLLAPIRHAPSSALAQLAWILENWASVFDLASLGLLERLALPSAIRRDEERQRARAPGPGAPVLEPMRFAARALPEERRYSLDTDWMPRVVLLAKSVYVWLGQLSREWGREVSRLDQIPDEELARLAARGFTGLWLIGVFERSSASRRIKQMRGDTDALASAYSLKRYDVAAALGGEAAWRNLSERAARYGIRLAADMVPNHVAIDADWVVNHPDWFVQTPVPPYPAYRFGGPDLSEDPRVGVFLEEGYWSHTDAAVVFRRLDRWTGAETFIYHGNDGTSMPWNDTAQLDYTKPEVRWAVIQTILHVARMFPIIRFDAAMTLAKRHYQRLWFPLPGHGSDIPSRAAHAMTQEEFDARIPVELWREVVDTVAREAPGTLLLAEAFWLMEGYFVRTLGMHRVYNSAFMNMLKREENAKYRETIKNVLDFDPHILERFVNFMSNPDEETAIAQFGDGDRYFGACVLLSTLPGLPMFAHGQVEGLHEKYGMEYGRAKWDEHPVDWLVARHEREIFPLLRRRELWSGVASFALYDFETDGGVDENVFAYSNRAGDERGLVVFHNKYAETRGRVQRSVPARGEDGSLHAPNLVAALALPVAHDAFVVFRDVASGLEWLRATEELAERGLTLELHAFEAHVFTDFRVVYDSAAAPWRDLVQSLGGRPVPSAERALAELRYGPLHAAIARALRGDEPAGAILEALARGLAEVCARDGREPPGPEAVTARTRACLAHEPEGATAAEARILRARAVILAALDLFAGLELETPAADAIQQMALDRPLHEAFAASEPSAEAAGAAAQAALLLATLPEETGPALLACLDDERGRAFLYVHAGEGVEWLNQERWETLARLLHARASGAPAEPGTGPETDYLALGVASGWRVADLRALLQAAGRAPEPDPSRGDRRV